MKQELDHNTKDDLIASGSTIVALVLIIVLLLAFGLKSIIPPPPPKKTFYVDIAEYAGGGGGGGTPDPTPSTSRQPSGQTYATQNAQAAPSVAQSDNPSTTNSQPAVSTPKPDQSKMFQKGKYGTGSGGGSGSGIGSGTGSGLGPGEGGGSGGGIGYGTGTRGMINSINTTVNEEGQVCVEVHVTAEGNVISARVINTSKFKTTIMNSSIQAQCIAQAKQARYKPGKEELRVIIFH